MRVLIIGSGYMAREYAKVLRELGTGFDVIGRGQTNCDLFSNEYPEATVYSGGLEKAKLGEVYTHAIICSNIEFLSAHTRWVIEKINIRNILLEKPGGLNSSDINELATFVESSAANVFIAYNRRFYASVDVCKKMIEADGGVSSFHFEFTEWPHTFEGIPNYEVVKQNLLFANSSHVIDLAFYLGGFPSKLTAIAKSELPWHSRAIFAGVGVTNSQAVFNYQANWHGPGRWAIEFITCKRRYYLKPLETVQIQEHGSVRVDKLPIDDAIDVKFKPGLFRQCEAFLHGEVSQLMGISEQARMSRMVYDVILKGSGD